MQSTFGVRPAAGSALQSPQAKTAQPLTFGKIRQWAELKDVRALRTLRSQEEKARALQQERDFVAYCLDGFKKDHESVGINGYHLATLYSDSATVRKHADLLTPLIQAWAQTLESPIEVAEALDEVRQRLKVPSMWNITLFAPLGGSSWSNMFTPMESLKSLFRKENRRSLFMPKVFLQPLLARKRELDKEPPLPIPTPKSRPK